MINRVVLVGRLARDPNELRVSPSGVSVSGFTVAVDNRFSRQEDRSADFIPCVVFNKTAEFVCNYAKKGSLVGVEGRLQSRSYERDGRRNFVVEVLCDSVQLLEPKSVNAQRTNDGFNQSQPSNGFSQINEEYSSPFSSSFDVNEDDLPF